MYSVFRHKKRVWAEHAACQIYMWIHKIGKPMPCSDEPQQHSKGERKIMIIQVFIFLFRELLDASHYYSRDFVIKNVV